MNSERIEEVLALYALGVPTEALCEWFDIEPKRLRQLASDHLVKRPDRYDGLWCDRVARCERIRRNVEEYPGTSLFSTLAVAA